MHKHMHVFTRKASSKPAKMCSLGGGSRNMVGNHWNNRQTFRNIRLLLKYLTQFVCKIVQFGTSFLRWVSWCKSSCCGGSTFQGGLTNICWCNGSSLWVFQYIVPSWDDMHKKSILQTTQQSSLKDWSCIDVVQQQHSHPSKQVQFWPPLFSRGMLTTGLGSEFRDLLQPCVLIQRF